MKCISSVHVPFKMFEFLPWFLFVYSYAHTVYMYINIHTYICVSLGKEEGMEGKGGSLLNGDLQCKLSSSQLYVLAIKVPEGTRK